MTIAHRHQYIEQLFLDNGVVELRVLGSATISGCYDDLDALLRDARQIWRQGHVYSSLNTPRPRAVSNRLGRGCALKDNDISWITRLPFDFDPTRPPGVSSTDAELDLAYVVRNKLVDFLVGLGWPEPIRACSGNGYHAQFATRLPNNHNTRDLLGKVYTKLGREFSNSLVQFDTRVRNPSRVFRLYGTVNRKGHATEERPHRQSDVLMPKSLIGVMHRQLIELDQHLQAFDVFEKSVSATSSAAISANGQGDYRTLDVVSWFVQHGFYKRPAPAAGKHFVRCPWFHEHSTPDAPEKTGTILYEADGGWPGFYCSHAHCEGRNIRDVLLLWPDADDFCNQNYIKHLSPLHSGSR
jgi:hypothetical protein